MSQKHPFIPTTAARLRYSSWVVVAFRWEKYTAAFSAKIISLLLAFIGFSLACRALQDNVVQYFSQNVINGKWLDISELRLHSNNSQSRARALAPFHKLPEPSSSYSSITRYCRAEPELSWLVSTGSSWSRIRAACPTLIRHFNLVILDIRHYLNIYITCNCLNILLNNDQFCTLVKKD